MKRFMMVAAVVSMAASGCVNSSQFLRSKSDSTNNFSQSHPQTNAVQTVGYDAPLQADRNVKQTGGLLYGLTGNHLQNCSCDQCCEMSCGYPEQCCDECCDCTCGCPDECCDCGSGCDCGCGCDSGGGLFSGGLFGNKKKKNNCNSCQCNNGCCNGCNGCGGDGCGCRLGSRVAGCIASGGCCPHSGGYPEWYNFTPGPQGGQVAYPYYTTRGPRDFLMCNPQPLGPY